MTVTRPQAADQCPLCDVPVLHSLEARMTHVARFHPEAEFRPGPVALAFIADLEKHVDSLEERVGELEKALGSLRDVAVELKAILKKVQKQKPPT